MLKDLLQRIHDKTVDTNLDNILSLIEEGSGGTVLDLGCGDGENTIRVASKMCADTIIGIEIVDDLVGLAEAKGVTVIKSDLNLSLPIETGSINVVHTNQVIEHIYNIDIFLKEILRVLRPDGYVVLSTENLASWHNIIALFLGWQPFSLTNIMTEYLGVGNPLAMHRHAKPTYASRLHVRVPTRLGLKEMAELTGFSIQNVLGAGYYPLPSIFARFDTRHSVFLTIKMTKKRTNGEV